MTTFETRLFGVFPLFRDSLSDRLWSGRGGGGTFRIVQRGVEGSGKVEAGRAERMKQPEGAMMCRSEFITGLANAAAPGTSRRTSQAMTPAWIEAGLQGPTPIWRDTEVMMAAARRVIFLCGCGHC